MDLYPSIRHHYWVDNLDPWLVHFSGNFGIRWYGVAYAAGILFAAWIFSRWARQGRLAMPVDQVGTLITYAAMGVLVGGRLGYCILYNAEEVLHHPLEILAVWHGGMASHGGILGLVFALWLFAHRRQIDLLQLLDAAAVGPLGIAFGRVANFFNGELWGRPTTVPWAVIFPQAPLIQRASVPRHPSQLYACFIEGLLVFFIAQWIYARTTRLGLTTTVVCSLYGVGRFVDEFWRESDFGQPVYWGWMSKGQLLTIPVIVIGIFLAIRQSQQGAVPKG
jgi:phosphatidylglycerol:prolipoprotein diacylglycerol transferase